MLKKLPIGMQSFEKLRANLDEYVYVDKTKQIYDLINTGSVYFLSRPRRFGKSLLCSTLQALFEGKRELFKNLWIDQSDYDWKQYPVIYLNLALLEYDDAPGLRSELVFALLIIANQYGISVPDDLMPGKILQHMCLHFEAQKQQVVIIIDEYDKPILDYITHEQQARVIRDELAQFYGVIKNLDKHIKFLFITGVTKFSRTSIFSALNHLEDLTLHTKAATLCGYTQTELDHYFLEFLNNAASSKKIPLTDLQAEVKKWYNGYRFGQLCNEKVYNPFSILLFCSSSVFNNYWFKTGTPIFLIDLIKANHYPAIDFVGAEISDTDMESFDIGHLDFQTLLLQAGYLTIDSYDEEEKSYFVKFPNEEVSRSLTAHIMGMLTKADTRVINKINRAIRQALTDSNIELLCTTLQQFFDLIPYTVQVPYEKYWQSLFYVLLMQLGINVRVEDATSAGRVDVLITTDHAIFIIELKLDKDPQEALQQIKDKRYAVGFVGQDKKIFLVGIALDKETRKIEYVCETHVAQE